MLCYNGILRFTRKYNPLGCNFYVSTSYLCNNNYFNNNYVININ